MAAILQCERPTHAASCLNAWDCGRQGETVPYIICVEVDEDGQPKEGSSGLAERAYHRDELATNPALRVDVQYYLSNQAGSLLHSMCGV